MCVCGGGGGGGGGAMVLALGVKWLPPGFGSIFVGLCLFVASLDLILITRD